MTDLQKVEFEILKSFIDVCEQLNLKYYLICGSALGAVKYNGFIPWDDDIDVALPRQYYNILMEEGQKYLPSQYFLQNYKNAKGLALISAKIKDSRTTYIEKDHCHLKKINHGVFIDVIPLDYYPEDDSEFLRKFNRFNRCRRIHLKSPESYKNKIKNFMKPFFNINRHYQRFEEYLSRENHREYPYYCNLLNAKNNNRYLPVEFYGDGICAKFEGIDVIIPEKYDEYLTAYYGDWRADLPKEQQVGHHYYEILDLNRPYTDYIGRVSKCGRQIKLKK